MNQNYAMILSSAEKTDLIELPSPVSPDRQSLLHPQKPQFNREPQKEDQKEDLKDPPFLLYSNFLKDNRLANFYSKTLKEKLEGVGYTESRPEYASLASMDWVKTQFLNTLLLKTRFDEKNEEQIPEKIEGKPAPGKKETYKRQDMQNAIRDYFSPESNFPLFGSDHTIDLHSEYHTDVITAVAFVRADLIMTSSKGKTIRGWRFQDKEKVQKTQRMILRHSEPIEDICALSTSHIASVSSEGTLIIWDLESQRPVLREPDAKGSNKIVRSLWTEDEKFIIMTGGLEPCVYFWEARVEQSQIKRLTSASIRMKGFAVSKQRNIAFIADESKIHIFSNSLEQEEKAEKGIFAICLDSEEKQLITSYEETKIIKLWLIEESNDNTLGLSEVKTIDISYQKVWISPLFSGEIAFCTEESLFFLSLTDPSRESEQINENPLKKPHFAVSPDLKKIYMVSEDHLLRFDVPSINFESIPIKKPPEDLKVSMKVNKDFNETSLTMTFSSERNKTLVYSLNSDLYVYDLRLRTNELVYSFRGKMETINAIAISSDDSIIAVGDKEGKIAFFTETQPKEPVFSILRDESFRRGLIVLNDMIFYGSETNKVCAFDYKSKDHISWPFFGQPHNQRITVLCPSKDCKYIYSGAEDGGIISWEISSFSKIMNLPGHNNSILFLGVSQDCLVSISEKQIINFDLKTNEKSLITTSNKGVFACDCEILIRGASDNSKIEITRLSHSKPIAFLQKNKDSELKCLRLNQDSTLFAASLSSQAFGGILIWELRKKECLRMETADFYPIIFHSPSFHQDSLFVVTREPEKYNVAKWLMKKTNSGSGDSPNYDFSQNPENLENLINYDFEDLPCYIPSEEKVNSMKFSPTKQQKHELEIITKKTRKNTVKITISEPVSKQESIKKLLTGEDSNKEREGNQKTRVSFLNVIKEKDEVKSEEEFSEDHKTIPKESASPSLFHRNFQTFTKNIKFNKPVESIELIKILPDHSILIGFKNSIALYHSSLPMKPLQLDGKILAFEGVGDSKEYPKISKIIVSTDRSVEGCFELKCIERESEALKTNSPIKNAHNYEITDLVYVNDNLFSGDKRMIKIWALTGEVLKLIDFIDYNKGYKDFQGVLRSIKFSEKKDVLFGLLQTESEDGIQILRVKNWIKIAPDTKTIEFFKVKSSEKERGHSFEVLTDQLVLLCIETKGESPSLIKSLTLGIIDLDNPRNLKKLAFECTCISIHREKNLLLISDIIGNLHGYSLSTLRDFRTLYQTAAFSTVGQTISKICMSPEKSMVLGFSNDFIMIWDANLHKIQAKIFIKGKEVICHCIGNKAKIIAAVILTQDQHQLHQLFVWESSDNYKGQKISFRLLIPKKLAFVENENNLLFECSNGVFMMENFLHSKSPKIQRLDSSDSLCFKSPLSEKYVFLGKFEETYRGKFLDSSNNFSFAFELAQTKEEISIVSLAEIPEKTEKDTKQIFHLVTGSKNGVIRLYKLPDNTQKRKISWIWHSLSPSNQNLASNRNPPSVFSKSPPPSRSSRKSNENPQQEEVIVPELTLHDYHKKEIIQIEWLKHHKDIMISLSIEENPQKGLVIVWDIIQAICCLKINYSFSDVPRCFQLNTFKGDHIFTGREIIDLSGLHVQENWGPPPRMIKDFAINSQNEVLMLENTEKGTNQIDIFQMGGVLETSEHILELKMHIQAKDYQQLIDKNLSLPPFGYNYLHLFTFFESFFDASLNHLDPKLTKTLKMSLQSFLSMDFEGKTCIDLLLINKNKSLLKTMLNYIFDRFEGLEDEEEAGSGEFENFWLRVKFFSTGFGREEPDPNIERNFMNFLYHLLDLFGEETDTLIRLLDLSFFPMNESKFCVDNDHEKVKIDLLKPVYIVDGHIHWLRNSTLVEDRILRKLDLEGTFRRLFRRIYAFCRRDQRNLNQKKSREEKKSEILCSLFLIKGFTEITPTTSRFWDVLLNLDTSNKIFENKVLGNLIRYKWDSFGSGYHMRYFMSYFFFFLIYVINFNFIFPRRETIEEVRYYLGFVSGVFDAIELLLVFIYFYDEFHQIRKERTWRQYFNNIFNYVDLAIIAGTTTTIIMDFIHMARGSTLYELKIFIAFTLLCLWVKFLSFFRGIQGTGFLVRLVETVLIEMRFFVLMIFLVMLAFTSASYMMQYQYRIGTFDTFNVFYRLTLGDFTPYDEFVDNEDPIPIWVLMVIITVFLSIIMLNLLISIIGSTYEKVFTAQYSMRNFELLTLISEIEKKNNKKQNLTSNSNIVGDYLICFHNHSHFRYDEEGETLIIKGLKQMESQIESVSKRNEEFGKEIRDVKKKMDDLVMKSLEEQNQIVQLESEIAGAIKKNAEFGKEFQQKIDSQTALLNRIWESIEKTEQKEVVSARIDA